MAKNIAASVRQRLLNYSRENKRPFAEVLQYYAMERFLFRLSQSEHRERFILKGALVLQVWQAPTSRPTMDIDMLGKTSNNEESIRIQIIDILTTNVESDGIVFNTDTIITERITEDADYEGIRVRFDGKLDVAIIHMQIDIGFSDIVYPEPQKSDFPTILDYTAPNLYCYSRESVIAEKFEAIVKLGMINSRMKDFYDIWLLSNQNGIERISLKHAIRLTFNKRCTEIPEVVEAFQQDFIQSKQVQWIAFKKRLKQEDIPDSFNDIINVIDNFLSPLIK